ncbi:unnamed protein product, partial [Coccothraustes coccothraustes]
MDSQVFIRFCYQKCCILHYCTFSMQLFCFPGASVQKCCSTKLIEVGSNLIFC